MSEIFFIGFIKYLEDVNLEFCLKSLTVILKAALCLFFEYEIFWYISKVFL